MRDSTDARRVEEQIKQCYRSLLYRVTIEQTASKWKPASELGVMVSRTAEHPETRPDKML